MAAARLHVAGFTRLEMRLATGLLGVLGLLLAGGCGDAGSQPDLSRARSVALQPITAKGLRELVRSGEKTDVVLVNMWATWCLPCREEFPALVRLEKEYRSRGLQVILVSWDLDPDVAREYLAGQDVSFPSYLRAGEESDPEFIEMFEPRWTGFFPATFVYDRGGVLRASRENKLSYEELETMVTDVLER